MLTLAITKQSWCHPKPSRCETIDYHTSNSHECMKVNGEALQLHTVYKEPYFFTASHARIHISTKGTAVCFKAQILLVPLGFIRVKLHVGHCYGNGAYAYILVQ